MKNEDILLFSPSEIEQFSDNSNNYQIIDNLIGPLNLNDNITFNIQFMEDQGNQILTQENFSKLPIDIANAYKSDVKNEFQPAHFVKYKVENGKHMKVWQCGICKTIVLSLN